MHSHTKKTYVTKTITRVGHVRKQCQPVHERWNLHKTFKTFARICLLSINILTGCLLRGILKSQLFNQICYSSIHPTLAKHTRFCLSFKYFKIHQQITTKLKMVSLKIYELYLSLVVITIIAWIYNHFSNGYLQRSGYYKSLSTITITAKQIVLLKRCIFKKGNWTIR